VLGVATEAVRLALGAERGEPLQAALQRAHREAILQEADGSAAGQALAVFEMKGGATSLTFEQLHELTY